MLRLVVSLATLLLVLSVAAGAEAQVWRAKPAGTVQPTKADIAEARQRFTKGVRLYQDEGAVDAALVELQRAYDLAPNFKVLYNIGQVARTLRDFALAVHAFQRYLEDGGIEVPQKRREEILADLKDLEGYVATVDVVVNVDGAVISIDDAVYGTSPLPGPIQLNAGQRRFRADLDGRVANKVITLAGGDNVSVAIEVPLGPRPSNDPDPLPPDEDDEDDGAGVPVWVGLGFGAAGLIGVAGAITGGVALSRSNALDDERFAGTAPPDELEQDADEVRALAIATDVLIPTAVVAAGVTLVLWLTVGKSKPAVKPVAPASVSFDVPLSADHWGLSATVRY